MSSKSIHSGGEIERFLGAGETRLIAAAYQDPARSGELYVLPDGEADVRRQWTREHLRCMFDDCPAPALRAVSRANRRDGFSHGGGAGKHSPESLNHRQGKAVVAQWLRTKYPDALVQEELATDTQRSNVADVMLHLPNGRRVAFEIQYASLSVEEWRSRHESYVRQGIIDIWLWGHTRIRKSRGASADGPYKLDEVQDEVRKVGLRVTFLNPETAQVAVATSRWGERVATAFQRECSLLVQSLDGVRVSPRGLHSDAIVSLALVLDERLQQERERAELAEQARKKREADEAERLLRKQADDRRWAQLRAESAEARERALVERRACAVDDEMERPRAAPLACTVCGKRLDPILARSGRHAVPCGPSWAREFRRR